MYHDTFLASKKNHNTEDYKRKKDEENINILNDSDVAVTMKSRRVSWAGHKWRRRDNNIEQVTKCTPKGKRLSCLPCRWTEATMGRHTIQKGLVMLDILNGNDMVTVRETESRMVGWKGWTSEVDITKFTKHPIIL